ncbi:hypothetical protein MOV08_42460 [Streptomyces yunnanensis]|uniref:Gp5/Type VI secretion system Vgr protein OB-fold domain-containing protein n=1 Tax=Streptomyces yunnanensis TaxID=156453 RepID=A0ABY8AJW1_9ACTN|nr:hypothetical protein [Streptomyces yunnanensis]WEB45310.1 hypothetical protein MOV08_42460 [Streptomyces yunnanensis]
MNSRTITADRLLEAVPDDPTPLAVSTASKTKLGVIRLRFTKTAGIPDVECTRITVTLPVGDTNTDLTSNPGNIDYKHSSSGRSWSITTSGDRATYVCTPSGPGGKFVFTDTAHFTLILDAIPVGRLPGEASLALTASTATNQLDEEDWTVSITKAVDDFFFFRAFSCEQPQIPNNGTATLRWEGSEHETEYWLSYDGRDPQQVTGQSVQIEGITDTTTFVLDARTPNPDTKEFDQHHYLSTTVTVKEPTIVAKELTAKRINVPQTLTADSSNKTTTLHGHTTFEEDVTVMAQLIVNGPLTANRTITANDSVTVAANKTLTANGPIQANDSVTVAADKTLTANGPIQANDTVTVKADKTLKAANLEHPTAVGSGIAVKSSLAFQGTAGVSIPQSGGQLTVYGALTAKAGATAGQGELIANGPLTTNGKVSFGTALFTASPVRSNYAKTATKPREHSKWTKKADKDGFLVVEAASYEWFSDDEKHGRKHRVYVGTPGITYYFDLVAHGKKTQQNTQGVFGNVSVPVAKGSSVSVWISDIDEVASADTNVTMHICWYELGA